jgi:thioredoxin 2
MKPFLRRTASNVWRRIEFNSGGVGPLSEQACHIVCPHCTSINRVPAARYARQAKWRHCRQMLLRDTRRRRAASPLTFWSSSGRSGRALQCDGPVFERATGGFEPELRFLKVDTEAEAELSVRYNIRSVPAQMLFHKGNVIAQRAGSVSAEALRQWLRQHTPQAAHATS